MPDPPPVSDEAAWTVARLLTWTRDYLSRHDVDDARLCAEVLLAGALEMRRIDLYTRFDLVPAAPRTTRLREWVVRAAGHEPVAYITGTKEFFSLAFEVSPAVLIPRPETELLVQRVIDHGRRMSRTDPRILELGVGSGCVSVTVLMHLPDARVVATDVSADALAIAKRNAARHGVTDRLTLVEADRLDLDPTVAPEGGFDILVSNPPYVAATDMPGLAPTVRDHEPGPALTDGQDGLSFFRSIAADAPPLLADGGVVLVEVGAGQAGGAVDILTSGGTLRHVATDRDRVTGHERVVRLVRDA